MKKLFAGCLLLMFVFLTVGITNADAAPLRIIAIKNIKDSTNKEAMTFNPLLGDTGVKLDYNNRNLGMLFPIMMAINNEINFSMRYGATIPGDKKVDIAPLAPSAYGLRTDKEVAAITQIKDPNLFKPTLSIYCGVFDLKRSQSSTTDGGIKTTRYTVNYTVRAILIDEVTGEQYIAVMPSTWLNDIGPTAGDFYGRDMGRQIVTYLMNHYIPVRGKVMGIQDDQIWISLGGSDGLVETDTLTVSHVVTGIDPATKAQKVLGIENKATISVVKVNNSASIAKVETGALSDIKPGMMVELQSRK